MSYVVGVGVAGRITIYSEIGTIRGHIVTVSARTAILICLDARCRRGGRRDGRRGGRRVE